MRQSAPYAVIGIGVILMAFIAWWFGFREQEEVAAPEPTPSIELSEGLSIYTSGEHGFLLAYPEGAEVKEEFSHDRLGDAWSVNALPDAAGTPLLSIITYRIQNESSYPRHYSTLVRVGVSDDAREVARCTEARTQQGETALPDRTLGDETFNVFSFGDAGMMQYVNGVSYRTVHNGMCWAIEQIQVGSSYREEPHPSDIEDDVLEAEFTKLDSIIESFRFAR